MKRNSLDTPSRPRLALLAAAVVAAVLSTLLVGAPASASLSQCGSGRFCLWRGESFTGGFYSSTIDNYTYHDGDTFNDGFHLYDAANSTRNNSVLWARVFKGHHYSGSSIDICSNCQWRSLWDLGYSNQISSHFLYAH